MTIILLQNGSRIFFSPLLMDLKGDFIRMKIAKTGARQRRQERMRSITLTSIIRVQFLESGIFIR